MTVQAQVSARHFTRLALILAAAAALVLSMALSARPVLAVDVCDPTPDPGYACLHDPHQGVDSSDPAAQEQFACESEPPAPGEVLWHFVLSGVDPGITSELTIHAFFTGDGEVTEGSSWNPGGGTHQFFVITSGDDVLEDAWVLIGDSSYNNLVLSHICQGEEVEESESPSPTPEGSQAGGTGTPAPSVPNTALSLSGSGSLATIFFGAVLIASLGALAYANVTAVRRRR